MAECELKDGMLVVKCCTVHRFLGVPCMRTVLRWVCQADGRYKGAQIPTFSSLPVPLLDANSLSYSRRTDSSELLAVDARFFLLGYTDFSWKVESPLAGHGGKSTFFMQRCCIDYAGQFITILDGIARSIASPKVI